MPARTTAAAVLLLTLIAGIAPASAQAPAAEQKAPEQKPADAATAAAKGEAWEGEIDAMGQILGFVVHVTRDENGSATSATLDIPMQGVSGVALRDLVMDGESFKFTFAFPGAPAAMFDLKLDAIDKGRAVGTMSQGMATLPTTARKLEPGQAPKGPSRPQNPVPPFEYASIEVTFPGGAEGVEMAGTLTFPAQGGPHPAVVLVSGSGPQDRDETLLGHKPFLVLSDALTKAGIAVLRYDDRGVGLSTGDFGAGTTDDFARDAANAVAFLRTRKEVDPKRIGIIGHSEGGLIAPIIANECGAAFLVLLAGPGTDGKTVLGDQMRAIATANGRPEDNVNQQVKVQQEMLTKVMENAPPEEIAPLMKRLIAVQSGKPEAEGEELEKVAPGAMVDQAVKGLLSPWMRRFLQIDPVPHLEKVTVPVLALIGLNDTQVIASINLPKIEAALEKAGNKDVTCLGIKGVNHLFQTSASGSPAEYATISETISPAVLKKVTQWVRQRTGLEEIPKATTPAPRNDGD